MWLPKTCGSPTSAVAETGNEAAARADYNQSLPAAARIREKQASDRFVVILLG
jgi:hypothetical protein